MLTQSTINMPRISKIFLFISALCVIALDVYAKNSESDANETQASDLSAWAKQQAAMLPTEVDGVTIMRPVTNADGKAEVSDLLETPNVGKDNVFIAAVVYAAENLDRETDAIETIDFDLKRFAVKRQVRSGEGKKASAYTYTTAFQAADGLLSFASYDIDIEYKEKGILTRHITIEKMKPSDNKRHAELIEDFSLCNSRWLHEMETYVKTNPSLMVTHWADIKDGNVVKGMNETEVKLVGGAPVSVRKNGDRVKWMYSNDFVVIFTDGIVTTVIQ